LGLAERVSAAQLEMLVAIQFSEIPQQELFVRQRVEIRAQLVRLLLRLLVDLAAQELPLVQLVIFQQVEKLAEMDLRFLQQPEVFWEAQAAVKVQERQEQAQARELQRAQIQAVVAVEQHKPRQARPRLAERVHQVELSFGNSSKGERAETWQRLNRESTCRKLCAFCSRMKQIFTMHSAGQWRLYD
jgi:hypothetical protein